MNNDILSINTQNARKVKSRVKKKPEIRRKIFPVLVWTLLALWCIALLAMMFWAIINSVRTNTEFMLYPAGFPQKWKFDNYAVAVTKIKVSVKVTGGGTRAAGFIELLRNTLLYAVGAPFFAVLTAAIASYVVSKYGKMFRWVGALYALTIFCSYVPLSSSLAANLKLLKSLNMYDSMIGMWIWSSGAFGSMFLIYYATFKGVSWTYAEAAFIDGASHFRVFVQLMLPLTKTVFGALFITSFVQIWNDYMTPMIYMPSYPTIAYAAWIIQYSVDSVFAMVPLQLAGLTIVITPIVILFIAFKDKLMGNLTMGGLKG